MSKTYQSPIQKIFRIAAARFTTFTVHPLQQQFGTCHSCLSYVMIETALSPSVQMDTILCVHPFPSVPDLAHPPEMDVGVLLRGQHHLQVLNIATHCCCIKLVLAAELGVEPGENFTDEDHLGPQPFQLNSQEAQRGRHPTRLFPLIQLISPQLHNTHIRLCMLDCC